MPFTTDAGGGLRPGPGRHGGIRDRPGAARPSRPHSRTRYDFDAAGELTGLTLGDPGHPVDVDRAGGQVSRVTGVSGRYLAFGRTAARLTGITDGARSVGLTYTGDRLTSECPGVDGKAETYEYDGAGRLTKVTTPLGRVKLAAGYDPQGRITWVEQQGAGRSTIAYDPANGRTVTTLPGGATLTQEYDWAGRLVTERVGSTGRHVVYDGEGRVVTTVSGVPGVAMDGYGPSAPVAFFNGNGDAVLTVDPTGGYVASTYDAAHRPLVSTRADGSTVARTYDGQGRLATVTDPDQKVWTYAYNSRGQVTSRTDPLDRVRSFTYAADGDLATFTDESDETTSYGYDSLGRRTSTTDPLEHTSEVTYTAWDAVTTATTARDGTTTTAYNDDRQQSAVTDPTDRTTGYEYDTAGRLTAVVDAAGGRTVTAYDALGRPSTVTDARGSVLTQTYTAEGWIHTTTDANDKVTTYAPDPAGREHRVTDPLGQVTQTAHDRAGRVTDEWTPDGGRTRYGYDVMGRRNTATTPRDKVWKTEYDRLGRPTKATDPLTWTVQTAYDPVGRVVSRTDQNGVVTAVAYDDAERTVTTTDPLGVRSVVTFDAAGRTSGEADGTGAATTYGYDPDGNVTAITDPAGANHIEYDLAGRVTAEVDPMDRRTTGSYDALGRLETRTHPDSTTDVFTYDPVGNLTGHTDRSGADRGYAYDPANRLTTATDPLDGDTVYTYDDLGRQTSVTDPAGVVTHQAYDPVGRPAIRWDATGASWITEYDLDGNTSRTVDPGGVAWTFTYNSRGERTSAKWGVSNGRSYAYDKVGRLTTANDPYNTTYEYDARGRTTAQVQPSNRRTTFGYDNADRITSRTTPSGKATTWTYDSAGRLRTATDPLDNTSSYSWNDAGQLTEMTLPRGGTYSYGYDGAGRLSAETDPLDETTGYDYDGEGRLTTVTYPSGRVVTTDYDDAGRIAQQTAGATSRTFDYDGAGRLTSATSTGAPGLSFGYDNRGLLNSSTNQAGTTAYGYDAAQRLTAVTPPDGPASAYTYDADRGLLATVRGATNLNFTAYDGAGQLLTRSAVAPSAFGGEARTYDTAGRVRVLQTAAGRAEIGYRPDGQIASVQRDFTDTTTYGYDDAGRLTSAVTTPIGSPTVTASAGYTWDADGNRTGITTTGQAPVTAEYDLADQLTASSDGRSYSYDPDGLLEAAGPVSHAYNGFGEQTSVTAPAGTVGYSRDGLGRVSARTIAGTTTTLGYEGPTQALASSRTGTGPTTTMARTPAGQLIAEATTGATTLQAHANFHGDLAALKDDTGSTVRWTARYDPFGSVTSTTGTAPVPLGFQSMYTDPTSGLVDMGARQYDPTAGRFTTRDTVIGQLTAPISLHRYLYGNADPINHTDPDGHWPQWLDDAASTLNGAVDAVGSAIDTVRDFASDVWNDAKAYAGREWQSASNQAQQLAAGAQRFWDQHGEQIKATVAAVVVGAVVFGGCAALTAGAATPLCAALAGAAGGAVYGNLTCPEGESAVRCTATGAISGGVAGLTFALTGGLGFVASGALSGLAGDAVDQALTTGDYDWKRGAVAAATGGALGWLGGRLPGCFSRCNRNFYSVQSRTDSARLRAGGEPLPEGPASTAYGQGVYAFDSLESANGYQSHLAKVRGVEGLEVIRFSVPRTTLGRMRSLDTDSLPQPEIDAFVDTHYMAGHPPTHAYQHLTRGTQFGQEHFFDKSVIGSLRFHR